MAAHEVTRERDLAWTLECREREVAEFTHEYDHHTRLANEAAARVESARAAIVEIRARMGQKS